MYSQNAANIFAICWPGLAALLCFDIICRISLNWINLLNNMGILLIHEMENKNEIHFLQIVFDSMCMPCILYVLYNKCQKLELKKLAAKWRKKSWRKDIRKTDSLLCDVKSFYFGCFLDMFWNVFLYKFLFFYVYCWILLSF